MNILLHTGVEYGYPDPGLWALTRIPASTLPPCTGTGTGAERHGKGQYIQQRTAISSVVALYNGSGGKKKLKDNNHP